MAFEHFPNDRKPHDVTRRPFHRINSPSYDTAVDSPIDPTPKKRGPFGDARASGARNPTDFKDSGFLVKMLKLLNKVIEPFILAAIFAIPYVGPLLVAINQAIGMATGTTPIAFLLEKIAEVASKGIEGMIFDRYMRALPSWVPVGRKGFGPDFSYEEDGQARAATKEEEREVEGFLSASYVLPNDIVQTQWSRYRHWAFHVEPHIGYRYLIGAGNRKHPQEERYIVDPHGDSNTTDFMTPALRIYGQELAGSPPATPGSLECLFDTGSISKPPGDRGQHGVMFHPAWPYWPMVGDYFWAAGRWAYDCQRPFKLSKDEEKEVFPTQLNPLKALATATFEGYRFSENPASVPAVRFLFIATSEGGYVQFREVKDRKDATHPPAIALRDRDYEFIVDLPPHEEGKSPYPVGQTFEFMRNTLVIRPRLLMDIQFLPFGDSASQPAVRDDNDFKFLDEKDLMPIVELLRPDDPNKRPSQARVSIPLSKLAAPSNPQRPEAYGFILTLGWHDPGKVEAAKIVPLQVRLRMPFFYSQSGSARLHTCINGRWHIFAGEVEQSDLPKGDPDFLSRGFLRFTTLFLPREAKVKVVSSGIWLHGFGEFMDGETTEKRRLVVGNLIEMKKSLEEDLKRLRALKAQGVPIDDDRIKSLEEAIDAIDDIFDVAEDLVGESFIADWLIDIDAQPEKGEAESKRISKIARCLWLHPTPLINRPDQPMGWSEFIDFPGDQIGRSRIQNLVVPGPAELSTADKILAKIAADGGKPLTVRMLADSFTMVGSGNNMARQINVIRTTFGKQEKSDYDMQIEFAPGKAETTTSSTEKDPVNVAINLIQAGSGNPVTGKKFQLKGPNGESFSGVTDATGLVEQLNVPAGDYRLEVEGSDPMFVSATPADFGRRRWFVGLRPV